MSLLTIIQATCDRLSLTRPSMVVTSTDRQVRQLLALANEEGIALSRRGDWQALQCEATFVTVGQAEQTNTPIPADFDRFVPNTFYNRTQQRPILGPLTPQEWQLTMARPALGRVYLAFRERQGEFLITPDPTAGETIAYEYVSKNWALSSAGVGKAEFTSDDDDTYLDEELIKLGLRWRWKASKGLDYGEDMATYEREVEKALGDDGGSRALDISGPAEIDPWYRANLPEGNFGGV